MSGGAVHVETPRTQSHRRIRRLSEASVNRRFEAYRDVAWDDPVNAVDPHDPRFVLPESDLLGATRWYRGLHPELQARIGLHLAVHFLRIGIQFENTLQRGLLDFALTVPRSAPEFRYCYHEVIEEAQHTLMFAEFIDRAGLHVAGLPRWARLAARAVAHCGRSFPELFFVFVMGGEEPIDHVQRRLLASGQELHPLLERISRIHVIEEARHLSFARTVLNDRLPRLSAARRRVLEFLGPFVLGTLARFMLEPPAEIVRAYRIPGDVVAEYRGSAIARRRTAEAVAKPRVFFAEHALVPERLVPLWRRMGVWPVQPEGSRDV
ncbi:MAG: diiron oxygenase [Myxococcota bacterium]|nr:diiron oxygenase [Myxococcota bacterium]